MRISPFLLVLFFCSNILCSSSTDDMFDFCADGKDRDSCLTTKPTAEDFKCCWVSKKTSYCDYFPIDSDAFDVVASTVQNAGFKVDCGANFLSTISLISFVAVFLF